MEGEDVDRAAIATKRVGDLDGDDPPVALEQSHDPAREPRVPFVEDPVKLAAPPADDHVDIGLELGQHPFERPEREPAALTDLDDGDDLLADSSPRSQVDLAPSEPTSQRADEPSNPDWMHGPIVPPAAYPAIISQARPVCSRRRDATRGEGPAFFQPAPALRAAASAALTPSFTNEMSAPMPTKVKPSWRCGPKDAGS